MSAGDDDDELPAIRGRVGHRRRLAARRQPGPPDLAAVGDIIGTQVVVDRGSQEGDAAAGEQRPPDAGHAELEGKRQRRHVVDGAVLVAVGDLALAEIDAGNITPGWRLTGNAEGPEEGTHVNAVGRALVAV